MFGKLINGKIKLAPSNYEANDKIILGFNNSEDIMREYGFKEIIYNATPVYDVKLQELKEIYKETDTSIIIDYIPVTKKTLSKYKQEKILETKKILAEYLENNPLYSDCHGGKFAYYTCTQEKQSQFTSKFTAHQVLVASGIPDVMTWNAQGEMCEEWTDEECVAFTAQLNSYVTSLVSKQQKLEVKINKATTIQEVEDIDIYNYLSEDIEEV